MFIRLAVFAACVWPAAASAALLAVYNPAKHDRFLSGNIANPDFLLAGVDLTGVGVGTNGGVLISDQHVLVADHYKGGSYSFVNAAGQTVTIGVDQHTRLTTDVRTSQPRLAPRVDDRGNDQLRVDLQPISSATFSEPEPQTVALGSDVSIATLSRPITAADGLTPIKLTTLLPGELQFETIWAYDQNNRMGRNVLDGGSISTPNGVVGTTGVVLAGGGNAATWAIAYDFDTTINGGTGGVGGDEIGLVGGDSGHAALHVTDDGDVTVVGVHYAVVTSTGTLPPSADESYLSLSSYVLPYRDQIDAILNPPLASPAIPEPAAVSLLATTLVLLRRRQQAESVSRGPED
jgi:hypothetical protein